MVSLNDTFYGLSVMNQTNSLLQALKKQLRAQGKTYVDVAQLLDLSEASVKRLFASQNFSLQRLEQLCDWLQIEFTELMQQARQQPQLTQLTLQQEQDIAADQLLLLVAVSVINGFTYQDLLSHYELTELECVRKLAALDRLKIIDLLPGNRIRLRLATHFSWLPDGPIQRFFLQRVQQDFFQSRFDKETEKLLVLNGLLCSASNRELQQLMARWAREFSELTRSDRSLTMEEKHGTTLVLAVRQWRHALFDEISRSSVSNVVDK